MELHNLDSETADSNGNGADEIEFKPPEGFGHDPANYSPSNRVLMRFNERCRREFETQITPSITGQVVRQYIENNQLLPEYNDCWCVGGECQ